MQRIFFEDFQQAEGISVVVVKALRGIGLTQRLFQGLSKAARRFLRSCRTDSGSLIRLRFGISYIGGSLRFQCGAGSRSSCYIIRFSVGLGGLALSGPAFALFYLLRVNRGEGGRLGLCLAGSY